MNTALLIPAALAFVGFAATAQEPPVTKPATQAPASTDAYPVDTCIVDGAGLAPDKMQRIDIEGRKVKVCSAACGEKLRKEPQPFMARLDRATVDLQLPDYPLDRCPISGKPLGSMGEPVRLVLDNHLVQLCCKGCTGKARAQKAEIVRSIQAAAYAKQKSTYALKTCPNSGDALDPAGTIEAMHGPTLLRFCCEDCVKELDKTPGKLIAKVRAARPAQSGKPEAGKPGSGQPQKGHEGHEGHGKQPDKGQAAAPANQGGTGHPHGATGQASGGGCCGSSRKGGCGR